jgi:gas vesicle protein
MSNREPARRAGGGFFFGILFGLAVGALLALLFAPQTGDEMRDKLSKQGDLLRQRYEDAMAQARSASQQAQEEVMASMK